MIPILLLVGALASPSPPVEVVVRNSGGVRVTRTRQGGHLYEITARDAAKVSRIAASDPDPNVRYAAVMTLTDRTLLGELAQTASDAAVRAAARERLAVRVRSAEEIAREERLYAQANLRPEGAAVLARHDPSPEARRVAVFRVTDQRLLADIAAYDPVAFVRAAALNRLTDPALLDELAQQSLAGDVRGGALRRLQELGRARSSAPAQ